MTPRGPAHIRERHRRAAAVGQPPCHLCGMPIDYALPASDEWSYVLDHIVPLAAGGSDLITNKAPAHWLCNARKGRREHAPIIKRSGALTAPPDMPSDLRKRPTSRRRPNQPNPLTCGNAEPPPPRGGTPAPPTKPRRG